MKVEIKKNVISFLILSNVYSDIKNTEKTAEIIRLYPLKKNHLQISKQTFAFIVTCKIGLFIGRDNDLHRLLFLPNGLPDGELLTYIVKGQVLHLMHIQIDDCLMYYY